jgi:hypothetical protein
MRRLDGHVVLRSFVLEFRGDSIVLHNDKGRKRNGTHWQFPKGCSCMNSHGRFMSRSASLRHSCFRINTGNHSLPLILERKHPQLASNSSSASTEMGMQTPNCKSVC